MTKHKFDYDIVVIGSGAAGGASALMAASTGKQRVALIEEDRWGGSALNYSDVPLSALFHASHLFSQALSGARFGLSSTNLRYNYPTINNWKNIAMRRAGANSKKDFDEASITTIRGKAHFISPYTISVGAKHISARKFLIATGAVMADTGIKGLDTTDYLTPDSLIQMTRLPKTIFIAGAGSTGCEIAQYFAELGVKVLISDIAGRLLPREDEEAGQVLDTIFNRLGIKVLTQSRVIALNHDAISKKVIFMRGGQEKSVRVDAVMLCTGTTPNTDLGLENAGVKYSSEGIKVSPGMQSSMKHIYAAGDIVGGRSSTEKATLEARTAISNLINRRSKAVVDYRGLSCLTRTFPEIVTVGSTEDNSIRRDRKYRKVLVPLALVESSNTQDFRDGFIKLLADRSHKIIGATLVSPSAALIAQEIALAIKNDLTLQQIADTPHIASDWGETLRIAAARLAF